MTAIIDVWNVETFDEALILKLRGNVQLIRDYLTTDRRQFLEREASDRTKPYPTNPYGADYLASVEEVGRDMEPRTIRAWHYTRLVDCEVDVVRERGIYLSTLETLHQRLNAQVAAGLFSTGVADALYAASPFHEQLEIRSNKFWMTSHPIPIDDGGVTLLLKNWGGEATYFWLEYETLEKLVADIGRSRVLEIAVPLAMTRHGYSAGKAVMATFARTLGLLPDRGDFDLYSTDSLRPDAVLAVHSEGEANFAAMARGYPAGFVTDTR